MVKFCGCDISCADNDNLLTRRNAFMRFLNHYRQSRRNDEDSVCVIACEAGAKWSSMPIKEKCGYIQAARNAGYVYKARDRRMNRVMRHLRKTLANEERINLLHLSAAVKQMQLWKRKTLSSMCDDTAGSGDGVQCCDK